MGLYHYTNIEAVVAILTEKKLWFTDIRYLNDASELREGILRLIEATKKWRGSLWLKRSEAKEAIRLIMEELDAGLSEGIHCSFSFTRSLDQLSQWRAYGRYILEFDEKNLKQLTSLHTCRYENKEKEQLAFTAVSKAIEVIAKDMHNNGGGFGCKALDQIERLYELAATFKNEGFKEEGEVRALLAADETDDRIKYRTRGELVIPYIEVPISLDCIKAVHVGPMQHQNLAYRSLCGFVSKIISQHQEYSGNIEYDVDVTCSPIPLRHM